MGLPYYLDGAPLRGAPSIGFRYRATDTDIQSYKPRWFKGYRLERPWHEAPRKAHEGRHPWAPLGFQDATLDVSTARLSDPLNLNFMHEGQMLERSGDLAYTRPHRPPLPPGPLWSRRGRDLRGPGAWRFEWRDVSGPNRFRRGRYSPRGAQCPRHKNKEGLGYRPRPWETPTLRQDALVEPGRPDHPLRLVRWVRWQDNPEVVFDAHEWVDKRPPVTHLINNRVRGLRPGPVILPHPDQTLKPPRPPRYEMGLTWKADVGPTWMHTFYRSDRRRASYNNSIHPDDGTRRVRPVYGGGTRTYERYDETYADMFFAPRNLPFARPRSKALVGPLGQASPPWLRAKEAMHARGFVQMGYGPSYDLGCDILPLRSRR